MKRLLLVLVLASVLVPTGTMGQVTLPLAPAISELSGGEAVICYTIWQHDGVIDWEEVRDQVDQASPGEVNSVLGDAEGWVVQETATFFASQQDYNGDLQASRQAFEAQGCLFLTRLAKRCEDPFVAALTPLGCTEISRSYTGHSSCWNLRVTYRCGSDPAQSHQATKEEWDDFASSYTDPSCILPRGYAQ